MIRYENHVDEQPKNFTDWPRSILRNATLYYKWPIYLAAVALYPRYKVHWIRKPMAVESLCKREYRNRYLMVEDIDKFQEFLDLWIIKDFNDGNSSLDTLFVIMIFQ
jgi:hypothetical protein